MPSNVFGFNPLGNLPFQRLIDNAKMWSGVSFPLTHSKYRTSLICHQFVCQLMPPFFQLHLPSHQEDYSIIYKSRQHDNLHWQGREATSRKVRQLWLHNLLGRKCQASCLFLLHSSWIWTSCLSRTRNRFKRNSFTCRSTEQNYARFRFSA